jgi:zinc/manganese transport system substrate-binding protein
MVFRGFCAQGVILALVVFGSFFVDGAASSFALAKAPKLQVVTSIPDLAWAASEVGGELVEARALLRGTENPHFVDAIPEFTRLAAQADVVCIAGLDLEVGYMPPVLSRSGNAQVQPGGKGYCEAGRGVTVLDKPSGPIDRSMGDVHPGGNPHFYLGPKALAAGAKELSAALIRVDPANTATYQKGLKDFSAKMDALSAEIFEQLKPVRSAQDKAGAPILLEYHKEFAYFFAEYGLQSFGSVEAKPGVPPSAGRLAEIAAAAKAAGVRALLAADYSPSRTVVRFTELSGIQAAVVPTLVQPAGSVKTYVDLQRHIAAALVALVEGGKGQN